MILYFRSALYWGLSLGTVIGILISLAPSDVSRWDDYKAIRLGMPSTEAVRIVDSSERSHIGCGAHPFENRDTICRFEDPWREYVINFNPNTGLVTRKYYYFKRVRGLHVGG